MSEFARVSSDQSLTCGFGSEIATLRCLMLCSAGDTLIKYKQRRGWYVDVCYITLLAVSP